MVERGLSTVVDAVLCLLLVSGAVLTVTTAETRVSTQPADDTASVLATVTAAVEYSRDGARVTSANGTVAGLLARAAVLNASLDGRPVAPAARPFVVAVRNRTRGYLGGRTRVTAHWEPYREAPLRGTVAVGPAPPADADVTVATVTVPVGDRGAPTGAANATRTATLAARTSAHLLLPDGPGELPQAAGVVRRDVRRRLSVLAGRRAASARAALSSGRLGVARQTAVDGLRTRLAADLAGKRTDGTPRLLAGTVTVTVRRWES